jgi:hypothetical protein
VTVTVLFLWGALSDETSGLSFVCAAGPCQRSLSRVRVPWDPRPYFTVSDLRLPFSSPPSTRRVTVEVFDPASTRGETVCVFVCSLYISTLLHIRISTKFCMMAEVLPVEVEDTRKQRYGRQCQFSRLRLYRSDGFHCSSVSSSHQRSTEKQPISDGFNSFSVFSN